FPCSTIKGRSNERSWWAEDRALDSGGDRFDCGLRALPGAIRASHQDLRGRDPGITKSTALTAGNSCVPRTSDALLSQMAPGRPLARWTYFQCCGPEVLSRGKTDSLAPGSSRHVRLSCHRAFRRRLGDR